MEKIKLIFTAISTSIAYVFGGMDTMLSILIIFMITDFISGFTKAWALKEFNSSKFYIGGVKKLGILLIVAVAAQLDKFIHIDSVALRTVAISYYIANEGFSILENWGQLGLPLPKLLKDALAKLREENDNESK
ncbi:MAG: phage holin family protein [Parabacteroides sp.]|nr:phage holin family protein [Parabacteroides sp.]